MKSALLVSAAIAATIVFSASAQAQNYPWCAIYSGGSMGGGRNCGFTSFQQCQDTVSGIGGFCQQNPMYQPQKTRRQR